MTLDELMDGVGAWLSGEGPHQEVVVSSRIRLARNLKEFHFLSRASEAQRRELFRILAELITAGRLGQEFVFLDMEELAELDRQLLVERHLISRQHAGAEGSRGVAVAKGESWALMINEEDHLRMQVISGGLQLSRLWREVNQIDDLLESEVEYAYDSRLGYLTACPTNVGTGIRVSVMLHLPALTLSQQIQKLMRAARDLKLAVRGLYGEGTEALGDFYQVSNQSTLGQAEESIIKDFEANIIPRMVEFEMEARSLLAREHGAQLDDKIYRALGVLRGARIISTTETLALLSHVRMGVHMGRFSNLDLRTVNDLFLSAQPAHLQRHRQAGMEGVERGVARAELLRSRLANVN